MIILSQINLTNIVLIKNKLNFKTFTRLKTLATIQHANASRNINDSNQNYKNKFPRHQQQNQQNSKQKPYQQQQKQQKNRQHFIEPPRSLAAVNSNDDVSLGKMLSNYESMKFPKYEDELNIRRRQAKLSIIFRFTRPDDIYLLVDDLERFNCQIKNVFLFHDGNQLIHENSQSSDEIRSALIEFTSLKCVENVLLKFTKHSEENTYVPCHSRILLYRVFKNLPSIKERRTPYFNVANINFCSDMKDIIAEAKNIHVNDLNFLKKFKKAHYQIEEFYKRFILINYLNLNKQIRQ